MTELSLNSMLELPGAPRSVVVGIDRYRLENFLDETLRWVSYTMTSNQESVFSRWWLTDSADDGQWCWFDLGEKTPPADAAFLPRWGGIASIDFEGDRGPSTPTAALVVLEKGNWRYGLEKFADGKVMRFRACRPKMLPELIP